MMGVFLGFLNWNMGNIYGVNLGFVNLIYDVKGVNLSFVNYLEGNIFVDLGVVNFLNILIV